MRGQASTHGDAPPYCKNDRNGGQYGPPQGQVNQLADKGRTRVGPEQPRRCLGDLNPGGIKWVRCPAHGEIALPKGEEPAVPTLRIQVPANAFGEQSGGKRGRDHEPNHDSELRTAGDWSDRLEGSVPGPHRATAFSAGRADVRRVGAGGAQAASTPIGPAHTRRHQSQCENAQSERCDVLHEAWPHRLNGEPWPVEPPCLEPFRRDWETVSPHALRGTALCRPARLLPRGG